VTVLLKGMRSCIRKRIECRPLSGTVALYFIDIITDTEVLVLL